MLVIHTNWDSEAGCWYATSDDIPGLATGADTIEDLIERLKVIVPELVELNEIPVAEDPLHVRDAMMLQSKVIGSDTRRMRGTHHGRLLDHRMDRDHTFNLWWGCTKVSPACDHCYAEV